MIDVFTGSTIFAAAGSIARFEGVRASTSESNELLVVEVDWMDGSGFVPVLVIQDTGEVIASHVYRLRGVYNAIVRATNEFGDVGEGVQNIVVDEP